MDIHSIVSELKGEIDRISHVIGLLGGNTPAKTRVGRPPAAAAGNGASRRGGGITPAGRRKLSLAMKKRWAEKKRKG